MRGYLAETAPDFKQARAGQLACAAGQTRKNGPSAAPSSGKASSGGDYVSKYREFRYHETLFVFVREALANVGQDVKSTKKLAQLKALWKRALGK